jgi:hypothetical protein
MFLDLRELQMCHAVAMEKPKEQPESKFAEVIRKGKDKRASLDKESRQQADEKAAEISRQEREREL